MSKIPKELCQRDREILKAASSKQLTLKELQDAPRHIKTLHSSGGFLSSDYLLYRLKMSIYDYYEKILIKAVEAEREPVLLDSNTEKVQEQEFIHHVNDIFEPDTDDPPSKPEKEMLIHRARCIYRFLADDIAELLLKDFRKLIEHGTAVSDSEQEM